MKSEKNKIEITVLGEFFTKIFSSSKYADDFDELEANFKNEFTDAFKFLNSKQIHIGIGDSSYGYVDGVQGEYNEAEFYFSHPELEENHFIALTFITDSYGNDITLNEVKVVKGVAKTVTVYEPI